MACENLRDFLRLPSPSPVSRRPRSINRVLRAPHPSITSGPAKPSAAIGTGAASFAVTIVIGRSMGGATVRDARKSHCRKAHGLTATFWTRAAVRHTGGPIAGSGARPAVQARGSIRAGPWNGRRRRRSETQNGSFVVYPRRSFSGGLPAYLCWNSVSNVVSLRPAYWLACLFRLPGHHARRPQRHRPRYFQVAR